MLYWIDTETKMSRLVDQSVNITLFKMAVPMLAGTFAVNAYNLTDTWFVSKLGTVPLAAMSFTFPVVMIVGFFTMGLGTGALAVVARALGENDREQAARITTHAMVLAALIALALAATGIATIGPVFTLLGADKAVLPMIRNYMVIWYGGMFVVTIPMIMNNVIMGTGDTKAAGIVMVVGTVINIFLDPVMIFGWMGFPRLGITGAALATIISQIFSFFYAFHILKNRHGLIQWQVISLSAMLLSWKSILKLGIPTVLSGILTPLSMAMVTRIVAGFGPVAVAAMGAGGRMEMFAFMIPMSIGMSLVPFIAQNYGAGRFDRISDARRATMRFALIFGAAATVVFYGAAPFMAGFFSDDPAVREVMVLYLRIVSFGFGMTEVFRYSTFCLTGIHSPIAAALLNVLRSVLLLVPLSWTGAIFWGISGVFFGRLATDLISGTIGIFFSKKIISVKRRHHGS